MHWETSKWNKPSITQLKNLCSSQRCKIYWGMLDWKTGERAQNLKLYYIFTHTCFLIFLYSHFLFQLKYYEPWYSLPSLKINFFNMFSLIGNLKLLSGCYSWKHNSWWFSTIFSTLSGLPFYFMLELIKWVWKWYVPLTDVAYRSIHYPFWHLEKRLHFLKWLFMLHVKNLFNISSQKHSRKTFPMTIKFETSINHLGEQETDLSSCWTTFPGISLGIVSCVSKTLRHVAFI